MAFIEKQRVRLHDQEVDALIYQHESGLKHIHVESKFPELSFALSFPTETEDNTGVPHILEHMIMCGSKRFPQKDPFFLMRSGRSVAHIMNASTSKAITHYHFETTDQKDFSNLADLYIDLAFNPLLREEDFKREGWRIEQAEGQPPKLNGVVLNEMIGGFGNGIKHSAEILMSIIGEGTSCANNSGGHPLAIPALTYEKLKSFYSARYSTATSIAITCGPINLASFQEILDLAIKQRSNHDNTSSTETETPLFLTSDPQEKLEFSLEKDALGGRGMINATIPGAGNDPNTAYWVWSMDYQAGTEQELTSQVLVECLFNDDNPEFRELCLDTKINFNGHMMFSPLARQGGKVGLVISCGNVNPDDIDILTKKIDAFIQSSIENGINQENWNYHISSLTNLIKKNTPLHNETLSIAELAMAGLDISIDMDNKRAAKNMLENPTITPDQIGAWWKQWTAKPTLLTKTDPKMMRRWQAKLDKIAQEYVDEGMSITSPQDTTSNPHDNLIELPGISIRDLNPHMEDMAKIRCMPAYQIDQEMEYSVIEALSKLDGSSSAWLATGERGSAPGVSHIHIEGVENDKEDAMYVQISASEADSDMRVAIAILGIFSTILGRGGQDYETTQIEDQKAKRDIVAHMQAETEVPGYSNLLYEISLKSHKENGGKDLEDGLKLGLLPNLDILDIVAAINQAQNYMGGQAEEIRQKQAIQIAMSGGNPAIAGALQYEVPIDSILSFIEDALENPEWCKDQLSMANQFLEEAPKRVITIGTDSMFMAGRSACRLLPTPKKPWPDTQNQHWTPAPSLRHHVEKQAGGHSTTRVFAAVSLMDHLENRTAARVASNLIQDYLHEEIREKGGAYGAGMNVDMNVISFGSHRDPSPDAAYTVFDGVSNRLREMAREADEHQLERARVSVAGMLVNPGKGETMGIERAKSNLKRWRPADERRHVLDALASVNWDHILVIADMVDTAINSHQDITYGPMKPMMMNAPLKSKKMVP